MVKIKIFLASSSELEDDRKGFKLFIARKNEEWSDKGAFLEVVVWENFLDAISQSGLQKEYNKAIKECDIFVMLFFTKVGKYTQEEFETAFGQFKEANKPKIFTYFKHANINTGDLDEENAISLFAFKKKLIELGHYLTVYENIDQLQWKFSEQLDKLVKEGFIQFQNKDTNGKEDNLPKELTLTLPKTQQDEIIGREEELEELHILLTTDKRVVVVNGLGGIGKTTLAQVYVSKYYDEYKHIVWITQTSEDIATDFLNAGGLIENLGIEAASSDPAKIFEETIRKLKSIPGKPNLLVIDNAEATLKHLRNMLPSQPQWHLLATSRETLNGFYTKPLGFLNKEQAVQLFKKHSTLQKIKEEEIYELVEMVDSHTLTIEILAKTAQVQRYDASTLKQAIKRDLRANVEAAHNLKGGAIEKVGSYLSAIFTLSGLNENAIWLMKNLACLPSEFHSYDMLKELIVNEESPYNEIFPETLSEIVRKGWVLQIMETDAYKMHRIIVEVVSKQLVITTHDIQFLLTTLIDKLLLDQANDNPVDKFVWISFGKSLLFHLAEDESVEISTLQHNLALRLQDLGDYEGARLLLEKAVASNEKNFGVDHAATATIYSDLALVLKDLGDCEGARLLLEKAIAFGEKNLGVDHPVTEIMHSNLALTLQALGDYEGARLLFEKALASDEKNFGVDHPSIAIRYSNLASVLKALGDYEGARLLFEKALASDEKNFGVYHPTTARSYSNLGSVLTDLGDYERARLLLEKAVASNEKDFGVDHPSTTTRYSNLALVLQALGDYEGAKLLIEKALASDEKNFGVDHPTTAIRYSNLASVLKDLGDYEGARLLFEKALASDEKNFGVDHPTTATSYSNLGLVLIDLGDYEGARLLFEKALASDQKNFGVDHSFTAISYSNLAFVLQAFGDYPLALEYSGKALNILKKALPAGHANIKTVDEIYEGIKSKVG